MIFAQFPFKELDGALAFFFFSSSNRNRGKLLPSFLKKKKQSPYLALALLPTYLYYNVASLY